MPRKLRDRELERMADRAAMIHVRHNLGEQVEYKKLGYRGRGPKNYKRPDESIRIDVSDALYQSLAVDASDIEVEVQDGCVYLRGRVYDRQMKKDAEECIEQVRGVSDVQNQLTFEKNASTH